MHLDYASVLRKMLAYQKSHSETWEGYYLKKMDLIEGCKNVGGDTVSCIIDGINVQTGARAGRYQTSEALYAEYLSTLQNGNPSTEFNASRKMDSTKFTPRHKKPHGRK